MSDAEEEDLGASGGGGHRISAAQQQAMQKGRATSAQRKRQRQERMQGNTLRSTGGAGEAVEQDMGAQHMADMRGLLEAALGERKRGAPVDIMRACMALGAYYIASDAERLPFEPRDLLEGERVALACSVSSLSKNTVRKLVSDFEFWGEIVLEEPGTRGAGAEAYSRWARPPEHLREPLRQYFEDEVINNSTPVWVTRKVVQQWFRDQTDVVYPYRTISRTLKAWGYKYGRLERLPRGQARRK